MEVASQHVVGIDEDTAAALFDSEMKEMRKLKRQFMKELRAMVEGEVLKERQRRLQEERVDRYKQKMALFEAEKKQIQKLES